MVRVANGSIYPLEKAASLKLENIVISKEIVAQNNVPNKEKKLPKANDLFFSIMKCCHMGMINSLLNRFEIKANQELSPADEDKFLEALQFGYKIFERANGGTGYLIRTKEDFKAPESRNPNHTERPKEETVQGGANKKVINYFEFTPMLFEDYSAQEDLVVEEFNDFDEAMRVYYDNYTQIGSELKDDYESQVWKKYENIKVRPGSPSGRPGEPTEGDKRRDRRELHQGAAHREEHQRSEGHYRGTHDA